MASRITKIIRLSVPVLSTNASRMLSTIGKTSLSETAPAADQKATATVTVTDQKARLSTVAPMPEYPLVTDSKDNVTATVQEWLEAVPTEILNWYAKELLTKGLSEVMKELMKDAGYKKKVDRNGLKVQVNISGFDHKNVKAELLDGYLVLQGETTDLMGKSLKIDKRIAIFDSEDFDKEKLTTDSKNGLLKVVVPYIDSEKR